MGNAFQLYIYKYNEVFIMNEQNNYYGIVYKITNTINNKSYIGITTNKRGFNGRYYYKGNGIERVYKYHVRQKERGRYYNQHLLSSIELYGFDAFEVNKMLDVAYSKEELSNKEIFYIQKYDSFYNGYNMTLGGETGCGQHQLKGKDNPLSKPICQLTYSGELVKIWYSLNEIKENTNYNIPNIKKTCKGINSNSYGYLWIYKSDYDSNNTHTWKPSNNYKSVVLLDDNGQILNEFISIKEASEYLGIDRTTVRSTCNNRWKHPKYNLKFKNDL